MNKKKIDAEYERRGQIKAMDSEAARRAQLLGT